MMNKGVAIRYGDVAPEAKENFVPTASESEFDNLSQLQQYNLDFPNYANPCELYQTVLDGTALAFPSIPERENLGFWSRQISNDDGTFNEPIVLELQSEGLYSSRGLTLTFDTNNGIFATRLNVKWLRITDKEITTLSEKEYTPDNAVYFCNNAVEYYNKIIITFYSINMPKNRLKFRSIDYGYGTVFYGYELKNVKLIQEIDPISTQITINTTDFIIDSKGEIEYSFQERQPLNIYFNGNLMATAFVKKGTRKTKKSWQIQGEDYIGLMDSIPYYGGIYNNKNAIELLTDIFTVAKVPYIIDDVFADATVTGYIPFTTCRDSLMQVAFAIQAVVDTSNSEVVKVFALEEDVKQTVHLNRIMQGQNFANDEIVTGVEVTSHAYKPTSETKDVYDATESGVGENVFIKFSEPLHDLSISNGEIVESGTNYVVINAYENCILKGQKYEHTTQTKRKNNPLVLASDLEKIVSVDRATLVSQKNIDNVLEKCYNWVTRTRTTNLDIVEGKHIVYDNFIKYGEKKYGQFKYGEKNKSLVYDKPVNVGERIAAETEYLGTLIGVVTKQTFNLNGNIIIKKTTMR